MVSLFALLLLAASATQAAVASETQCNFTVDAYGYVEALLEKAINETKNTSSSVKVTTNEYVVDFLYKNNETKTNETYVLWINDYGLVAVPDISVYGPVLWWGNSETFHIYADAILDTHTVYYNGAVGRYGNLIPCNINLTKTDYIASTYKRFVYNATTSTYDLKVHILDAKSYGKYYYNISIPNASEENQLSALYKEVHKIELLKVRDWTLTVFTDYVLAIMDKVNISSYTNCS